MPAIVDRLGADSLSDPFNPFRILQSVQRGILEPAEAAAQLTAQKVSQLATDEDPEPHRVTNRAVLRRLASYAKDFDVLIWAYDQIVAQQVPHRSMRTSIMDQLSTRLGISRRQVLRMLTEFEPFKPTLSVNREKEAHERRATHLANLEELATTVYLGEATVSQLLEIGHGEWTSRPAIYRAVSKVSEEVGEHFGAVVSLRDIGRMTKTARARYAREIRKFLKEKRENAAI